MFLRLKSNTRNCKDLFGSQLLFSVSVSFVLRNSLFLSTLKTLKREERNMPITASRSEDLMTKYTYEILLMEHGAREKEIMDVTKPSDEYHAIKSLGKKRKFSSAFFMLGLQVIVSHSPLTLFPPLLCCSMHLRSTEREKNLNDVKSNQM
jgi:hypothetical protein